MRAVNLLPRDDARRRADTPNLVVLVSVLTAVLLTAILAGGFLMEHSKATDKQRTLDAKKTELSEIPTPPKLRAATDKALVSDKSARVTALSTALSHRIAWDRIFREFSQVLPSDVWLSELTASAPVSSAAAATTSTPAPGSSAPPTGFTIQGYTYSHDAAARFLSRLMLIPDLKDVQLQQSVAADVRGRTIVQFSIGGNVSTAAVG